MVHSKFNRSEVVTFFDLTERQKNDVLDCYYNDREDAENDSFVIFEAKNKEYSAALPLSQFMRVENGKSTLWDGVFGTSYFSAYFIKLSKCGSMAVVAEKYW